MGEILKFPKEKFNISILLQNSKNIKYQEIIKYQERLFQF